jgi:hypothetical protein
MYLLNFASAMITEILSRDLLGVELSFCQVHAMGSLRKRNRKHNVTLSISRAVLNSGVVSSRNRSITISRQDRNRRIAQTSATLTVPEDGPTIAASETALDDELTLDHDVQAESPAEVSPAPHEVPEVDPGAKKDKVCR